MSERYDYTPTYPELEIIPADKVQVAWQTHTELPTTNIDEAWRWISRLGLAGEPENGAGWGLPNSWWVPRALRSPENPNEARELYVGARVRDVAEGSYGEVVEIDPDRRTVLFKSDWPSKIPGQKPLLYTYRMTLDPGWDGEDTTILTTEMRATDVRHPRLMQKFGPALDAQGMRLFARGLTRRVDPEQAALASSVRVKKRLGAVAAVGVGLTAWKLAKESGKER